MNKFLSGKKIFLAFTTAITLGLPLSGSTLAATFRSIDGSGNNLTNSDWGTANTKMLRLAPSVYEDSISVPINQGLPSARAISNAVAAQSRSTPNSLGATDWLWQWGQFIDHDLDLTEAQKPEEAFNISIPQGDPFFDPFGTGTQEISLNRSIYDPGTGSDINNPREQINEITSYLDGSMVYGSDLERANFLRTQDGTGKLKTSAGNLLPFNTAGLSNAGGPSPDLFLAGDVRANEQVGLAAVHTLFVREHNRLAEDIATKLDKGDAELLKQFNNSGLSEGEFIYQTARKIVGAQIQVITYNEFLPILLGEGTLDPYAGYDETVNATISNEFAHGAYRVGHTMLSSQLLRLNNDGSSPGHLSLRQSFFNTEPILNEGLDSLFLGLASQAAQEVDTMIIDDVRNFLFGPPGSGGFDLASLNIQRGRDHGLPRYNDLREILLGDRAFSFADITSDVTTQERLASVYGSVDEVDLWIGGLAEDHVKGGMVGALFNEIISDQFRRTRDGDRFFYLNDPHLLAIVPEVEDTTLSSVIRRNSEVTAIQDNAFILAEEVPEPSAFWGFWLLTATGGLLKRKINLRPDR